VNARNISRIVAHIIADNPCRGELLVEKTITVAIEHPHKAAMRSLLQQRGAKLIAQAVDKSGRMAALGGFASKMGLASGPMVSGLLLGDGNYTLLINVSVLIIALSMAASLVPAWRQDKAATL